MILKHWQTRWQQFHSRHGLRVKTPTVLQIEAVECGAAALGMILSYYGRIVPLAELRQACGVSRDGSSAANVVAAGRTYGMDAKGFKKTLDNLQELTPPYIVYWQFDHFLVVEGFIKDQVYVNDPASGPRQMSLAEFDRGYTGIVLVMRPGEKFQPGGMKRSIFQALHKRLQHSIPALIYCVLAGFLLVLPNLALPVFSQIFIDSVLMQNRWEWLWPLLFGLMIVILLQGVLTALQLRYLRRLKIKLAVGLSSQFIWHVLRLPISFYGQRFPGEISSRVSINDQVADILTGQLTRTIISLVMVVFYAVVMLWYNWILTLVVIGLAIANVVALQWVAQQRVDANLKTAQNYGKVNGVAIAGLQSIETLKASGLESDFFARWAGYYTKASNAQQELNLTNQRLNLLPAFLTALSTVLILVIGGWQVVQGSLTLGALLAFQLLMRNFLEPVNSLIRFGSTLQDLDGNLVRLDDVLDNSLDPALASEPLHATVTPQSDLKRLQGTIELRNITFGYSKATAPLIQGFNLTIQPGQRIALVGGSGSGKSTVAKLVAGLYEPWEGEIRFDGVPSSQIPRAVLTDSIAVVDQDILLFADTVRANLTLWEPNIADRLLEKACEDAAIYDIVLSLPGGLDAPLIEGAANLSGGQRQRLEIARALVNQPAILIMDEATSALDSETEKMIDRNLRRRGCTCLIVAHRLSTIRDCDEIIVLDRGKVIQRGKHEDLWQSGGYYANLISSEAA